MSSVAAPASVGRAGRGSRAERGRGSPQSSSSASVSSAGSGCFPDVLGVKSYLLPRLSDVLNALWDSREELKTAAWITFKEAFGGLVLGSTAAIAAALVLARWRPLGNALVPYLIAANAIPVIAFAPITNAWFGTLSPWSKVVIAAALCFFPVLVNTLRGLTSVHPSSIELMHAVRGPRARDLLEAPDSCLASVPLHGAEGRCCARDDRRRRRRLLRRLDGVARGSDPERRCSLALRARLGGDHRREPHRDGALRRRRPGRAVRRPLASVGAVGRLAVTDVMGLARDTTKEGR